VDRDNARAWSALWKAAAKHKNNEVAQEFLEKLQAIFTVKELYKQREAWKNARKTLQDDKAWLLYLLLCGSGDDSPEYQEAVGNLPRGTAAAKNNESDHAPGGLTVLSVKEESGS
jgi:hypothetical protein